ncbi:hypothetical protein IH992_27260 [Candidatus Poribacteria bacterium]|nr:hypothetical protein [Candidatus Poribacteria bacterium]
MEIDTTFHLTELDEMVYDTDAPDIIEWQNHGKTRQAHVSDLASFIYKPTR